MKVSKLVLSSKEKLVQIISREDVVKRFQELQ